MAIGMNFRRLFRLGYSVHRQIRLARDMQGHEIRFKRPVIITAGSAIQPADSIIQIHAPRILPGAHVSMRHLEETEPKEVPAAPEHKDQAVPKAAREFCSTLMQISQRISKARL